MQFAVAEVQHLSRQPLHLTEAQIVCGVSSRYQKTKRKKKKERIKKKKKSMN